MWAALFGTRRVWFKLWRADRASLFCSLSLWIWGEGARVRTNCMCLEKAHSMSHAHALESACWSLWPQILCGSRAHMPSPYYWCRNFSLYIQRWRRKILPPPVSTPNWSLTYWHPSAHSDRDCGWASLPSFLHQVSQPHQRDEGNLYCINGTLQTEYEGQTESLKQVVSVKQNCYRGHMKTWT